MTKFFNNVNKPYLAHVLPFFTNYKTIKLFSKLLKKKKMIQFQENVCIDRQMGGTTDGQILLYTTLPTTAGDPKKDHNSKTTNEKMNLELEQTKLHKY